MRLSGAVFGLLPLLAACAGGRGSSPALTVPQPPLAAPLGSVALTEAESDARQAPQPLYTPGTNDLLYVSNQGNNSITIYKHDVSGNTAPLKIIAGSKTGLESPGQLAEDAQGNLYVANRINSDPGSILVFAHGANGNVSAIRKLYGPQTKLQGIGGMTVDQATGKIFVGSVYYPPPDGYPHPIIMRFPPNATGNEAPFATYDFGCGTVQLTSDSSGKDLLVAWSDCIADSFSGVAWVGKQFPTAVTPPYGIDSFQPLGIADDPTTKTYLVTHQSDVLPGIVRLAEDTTGDGPDSPAYPKYSFKPKVVSDITSAANCGELALGYLRNIYAVCGTNTIKVFAHDSSGNVPPLRTLEGSATKLNQPYGIYEGR